MIIKSLSRKKPSFKQLISYFHNEQDLKEDDKTIISHNLFNFADKEEVLQIFDKNSKNLKFRKNGVFLYHEIISLPQQKDINIKRQKQILKNIAEYYLTKRAELQLAYGLIHEEKDHLHCHLMISSNEINSDKRERLSKEEFSRIQKEIESYKIEKFPELDDKILYNKEKTKNKYQSAKSKDQEAQFTHRTKEKSRAEEVKEIVEKSLLHCFTIKDFEKKLKESNIDFYLRGNTAGVIDLQNENIKYRIKRLDLQKQFENLLAFEKAREKEIESIKKIQAKSRDNEKER